MTPHRRRIGVLALQGDYDRHLEILRGLDVEACKVRDRAELDAVDGLVLPGGESTTLHILLRRMELYDALASFAQSRPLLGTCAGLILMATDLEDAGGVEPLGVLDMSVRRNGFGTQIDSFEAQVDVQASMPGHNGSAPALFIRAPRIVDPRNNEILARWQGEPVAVRHGTHVALSFHPELLGDPRWHGLWLEGLGDR